MALFVGGLHLGTNNSRLREVFGAFGELTDETYVVYRNRKSRGFGFVTFKNPNDAKNALNEMNGKELDGRSVTVFCRNTADMLLTCWRRTDRSKSAKIVVKRKGQPHQRRPLLRHDSNAP
mgnify:CR=1 FL=1